YSLPTSSSSVEVESRSSEDGSLPVEVESPPEDDEPPPKDDESPPRDDESPPGDDESPPRDDESPPIEGSLLEGSSPRGGSESSPLPGWHSQVYFCFPPSAPFPPPPIVSDFGPESEELLEPLSRRLIEVESNPLPPRLLPFAGLQVHVSVVCDEESDMSMLGSESPPKPGLEPPPPVAPVLLLPLPVLGVGVSRAAMLLAFSMAGMALAAARLSAMARKEIEMGCMMEKEVARGVMKKSALFVYPWPAGKR
ncbi:hypothetical protein ARMSODRAFT_1073428, partial [Armillaria solidipes]